MTTPDAPDTPEGPTVGLAPIRSVDLPFPVFAGSSVRAEK